MRLGNQSVITIFKNKLNEQCTDHEISNPHMCVFLKILSCQRNQANDPPIYELLPFLFPLTQQLKKTEQEPSTSITIFSFSLIYNGSKLFTIYFSCLYLCVVWFGAFKVAANHKDSIFFHFATKTLYGLCLDLWLVQILILFHEIRNWNSPFFSKFQFFVSIGIFVQTFID